MKVCNDQLFALGTVQDIAMFHVWASDTSVATMLRCVVATTRWTHDRTHMVKLQFLNDLAFQDEKGLMSLGISCGSLKTKYFTATNIHAEH